jgi:hypothetical protein
MINKSKIEILKKLDVAKYPWCNEAFIISVKNGKAALKTKILGRNAEWDMLSMIALNNRPLIQSQLSVCPTCAGMLATGYGIDKDNAELKEISNAINSPFVSLENSILNIQPLLGLLTDGVYAIADIPAYPTDGDGNYFWAVSNKLKSVSASVNTFLSVDDFCAVDSFPIYLYPSQSTENFYKERVDYYLPTASEKNAPRAIAYYIGGFISVLLDGHHKAAAAALSQNPINCITIIPFTSYSLKNSLLSLRENVYFSGLKLNIKDVPPFLRNTIKFKKILRTFHKISEGTIINNIWNDYYLKSANNFPTISELAEAIELDIKTDNINDEMISNCFSNINNLSTRKLRHIINVFNRRKDSRLINIALKCAKLKIDSPNSNIEMPMLNKLRILAFNILAENKNNKEIEQFFIDFLIDDSYENEQLISIANSYWQ